MAIKYCFYPNDFLCNTVNFKNWIVKKIWSEPWVGVVCRKILEKLKQDETLKSMEGSSELLSDADDLEDDDDDMEDDDEGLGHDGSGGPAGQAAKKASVGQMAAATSGAAAATKPAAVKSARSRPSGPAANKRVYGSMTGQSRSEFLSSDLKHKKIIL